MTYLYYDSVKYENNRTFICKERVKDIISERDLEHCRYRQECDEEARVISDIIMDSKESEYHKCIFDLSGRCYVIYYENPIRYENEGDWIEVLEFFKPSYLCYRGI